MIQQSGKYLQIGIAVLVIAVLAGISYKDQNWPEWTGFGTYTEKIDNDQGKATVIRQPRKTLWDMLQLLIVPAMLEAGAYWLDQSAKRREQQSQEYQAQETTVQSYLDKITDLLLKENLVGSPSTSTERVVARSRTLTALRTLDGVRKGILIRFLYESRLITDKSPVIILEEANLNYSSLSRADLHNVNLRRAKLKEAELTDSNLSHSHLDGADLSKAKLKNALMHGASLRGANLKMTVLSGARFHASPITGDELAALPERHRLLHRVKGVLGVVQEVNKALEDSRQETTKAMQKFTENQIALLQQQEDEIRAEKEAWLEGKDILKEESPDSQDELEKLMNVIDKQRMRLDREESDTYKDLAERERELGEEIRQAKLSLDQYIRADLHEANLEEADLRGADLRLANLRKAKLRGANLELANLSNADLTAADLKDADLTLAILNNTDVSDDQLKQAKSLAGAWRDGKKIG